MCFQAAHERDFRERKGGRVVECAGLEIRCTVIPYRGFESHPFRQTQAYLLGFSLDEADTYRKRQ